MQGSVPTRADADKFVAKAAEVIGAENVIDQYVIDPAAPPASDGFIRVDEPFLFPARRPPREHHIQIAARPQAHPGHARREQRPVG